MFKFTIRDLLWLTVVVALGVGWWAHQRRLAADLATEKEFRSRLEEYNTDYYPDGKPSYRFWRETTHEAEYGETAPPSPSAGAPLLPKK